MSRKSASWEVFPLCFLISFKRERENWLATKGRDELLLFSSSYSQRTRCPKDTPFKEKDRLEEGHCYSSIGSLWLVITHSNPILIIIFFFLLPFICHAWGERIKEEDFPWKNKNGKEQIDEKGVNANWNQWHSSTSSPATVKRREKNEKIIALASLFTAILLD